jgi:hypothetical protein
MADLQTVTRGLTQNTTNILLCLDGIDSKTMMIRPAEKSWSLMECFEHVHNLEKLLLGIFNGPTEHTDRDPADKADHIKEIFSNDTRKLNAPDPIVPKAGFNDKEVLEQAIVSTRAALILAAALEPDELCMSFAHHYFGNMTRLEWLYFTFYHSQRHLRQAERIKAQLVNMQPQS